MASYLVTLMNTRKGRAISNMNLFPTGSSVPNFMGYPILCDLACLIGMHFVSADFLISIGEKTREPPSRVAPSGYVAATQSSV